MRHCTRRDCDVCSTENQSICWISESFLSIAKYNRGDLHRSGHMRNCIPRNGWTLAFVYTRHQKGFYTRIKHC